MTKRSLFIQIVIVTVVGAALYCWLVYSMIVAYIGMGGGRTEAQLIRDLYSFCLVPPEWIRPPALWAKWDLLERYARLSVVVIGWTLGVATLIKRYLRGQQSHLTKRWSESLPGVGFTFR